MMSHKEFLGNIADNKFSPSTHVLLYLIPEVIPTAGISATEQTLNMEEISFYGSSSEKWSKCGKVITYNY